MTRANLAKEVMQEVRTLPTSRLREVRAYVYFLKARETVDPTQLYFWTKRWQALEREAEADKRSGRTVGDGTLKGLLSALKRR
jgi:hypothetical protein